MILKIFSPKKMWRKIGVFLKNGHFCDEKVKNLSHQFLRHDNFFAQNWRKAPKKVQIITLAPG
jgi:hypothetical protein